MTVRYVSGWHPDLPDPRDYMARHEQVAPLLRGLPKLDTRTSRVDWRPFCTACREGSGSAFVCVDLLEQCQYRVQGQQLALSGSFVSRTAHRLALSQGAPPLSLRATWKAVVRFGIPSLDIWPDGKSTESEPDAFAYNGARSYVNLRYVRLDHRSQSGLVTLDVIRSFVSAGFLCVFGLPWCTSVDQHGEIGYPTAFDEVRGGLPLMAVGYDDDRRVRSDRGCLLVRGCWGHRWGEEGYGWLPYAYVREKLASDFWIVFQPEWLESGEFKRPF